MKLEPASPRLRRYQKIAYKKWVKWFEAYCYEECYEEWVQKRRLSVTEKAIKQ